MAAIVLLLSLFHCAALSANEDANDDDEVGMFLTVTRERTGAEQITSALENVETEMLVNLLALPEHDNAKNHRVLQRSKGNKGMSMIPSTSPTAKSLKLKLKKKMDAKSIKKTTAPTASSPITTPSNKPTKMTKSKSSNKPTKMPKSTKNLFQ